tara:strand:- start:9073 stop:9672 length:600 start_codon:yes stop_codon:yes gene_type:complete
MAIFKPEMKSGSYSNFTGICEFGILEFKNRSGEFDWADLFIEVSVKQKGSDFDRPLAIKGSFDKVGGKITGGNGLTRLYHFFDQIGCDAGINVDGGWETANGEEIKDIEKYLNDNFVVGNGTDTPDLNYLGYFYKEQPKVPGGKAYTRVLSKVYKNATENKAKLEDDVQWMKSKGYLKEFVEGDTASQPTMDQSALGNL